MLAASILFLLGHALGSARSAAVDLSERHIHRPHHLKAVAFITGNSTVTGTIYLEQDGFSSHTKIYGEIAGLEPNAERGFHIHEFGDLTNGCASTGTHYNPFGKSHGSPDDWDRHVGDMGNIQTDDQGVARIDIQDAQIKLFGPWSVLGRAIVVHMGTDDLGTGENEGSGTTGNAGGRAACGVIGLTPTKVE